MSQSDANKKDIATYWTSPPSAQDAILHAEYLAELDSQIERSQMIHYKGKMIKLEDYPCQCELQAPDQCWQEKHPTKEYKGQQCTCPCHSVYEP